MTRAPGQISEIDKGTMPLDKHSIRHYIVGMDTEHTTKNKERNVQMTWTRGYWYRLSYDGLWHIIFKRGGVWQWHVSKDEYEVNRPITLRGEFHTLREAKAEAEGYARRMSQTPPFIQRIREVMANDPANHDSHRGG